MSEDGVDRIVEQWARERPELDTEAMSIFGRVFRIATAAGEVMEGTYARYGISRGDFDVLATLRRSGAPFQLSPGALSGALMLTTGGMTGRLDRLERAGLVSRSPGPGDRRSLLVTLTEPGRQVVDEAVLAGVHAQQRLLASIPVSDRRQLGDLLRGLLAAVTAGTAGTPPPPASRSHGPAGTDSREGAGQ